MADHVGIYALTGSVMSNISTSKNGKKSVNNLSVDEIRGTSTGVAGYVINMIPAEQAAAQNGPEVVNLNAYYSGTERIDFVIDPQTSLTWSLAERNVYLSKRLSPVYGTGSSSKNTFVRFGREIRVKPGQYGRTDSITDDMMDSSYAVLTFITGSMAQTLAAQGEITPEWFLGTYGTPYLPDSSMSLGNVSPEQVDAEASQALYEQTVGQLTLIPNANTLNDFLNREEYSKTTEQRWLEAVTGSQ